MTNELDWLDEIYYRCDVSNNRTDNPIPLEEFKAQIRTKLLEAETEAYKKGYTSGGIQEVLRQANLKESGK